VFAVDVDPDMTCATIASAWERPGKPGPGRAEIEMAAMAAAASGGLNPVSRISMGEPPRTVLEIPRGCSREGTAWVVPRLLELCRKWKPAAVAFPKNGPAAALGANAEQEGIEVTWLSSADEAAAFALIVTAIKASPPGVAHLGRDLAPGMHAAIASADTREVGDGGRSWCRRTSESDITPATAPTEAYWVLNKKRRNYDPLRSVAG
jgi:hypothetical protein